MCKQIRIVSVFITAVIIGSTAMRADGAPQGDRPRVQIVAESMRNNHVARSVVGQLNAVSGVQSVEVDFETRTVSIALESHGTTALSQLWKAVELAEGGPTRLVTNEATYVLSPPTQGAEQRPQGDSSVYVVVDDLHCKGCAKKIAAQLYVIRGVIEVRVDMPTETLLIKLQPGGKLSPWQFVEAVRKAKERPQSIIGPHGNLRIEWATKRGSKSHHHARQPANGGSLR